MKDENKQRLSRLEPENYQGLSWVHWIMTVQDRRTGWLDARFLYKFREVLAHAAFRYRFACPIYCLMPDHIHMLWCGLSEGSGTRQEFRSATNDRELPKVLATSATTERRSSATNDIQSSATDQRVAIKTFRNDLNDCLKRIGYEFQRQPYDHVLREDECEKSAIEDTAEYIARNPERKQLIPVDSFAKYPFTGCLLPGYPQIKLFAENGWDVIWLTLSFLKRTECFRLPDPKYHP